MKYNFIMEAVQVIGIILSFLSLFIMIFWGGISLLGFYLKQVEDIERETLEK